MGSETGNPREFEPVDDGKLITQFFSEGARSAASTLIWTKNQENVLHSHISLLSEADRLFYAWIPQDFQVKKFMDDVSQKSAFECLFSLSLSRANVFFKAKFQGIDSAGLKFEIPGKIYKVQRRKNMRYEIADTHFLPVEFEDPLFPGQTLKKRVIDISTGGLAFSVPDQEVAVYQTGLILKNLKFKVKAQVTQLNAEVRYSKKWKEGTFKVGVSFQNIDESKSDEINDYIFQENRKFYSRFL